MVAKRISDSFLPIEVSKFAIKGAMYWLAVRKECKKWLIYTNPIKVKVIGENKQILVRFPPPPLSIVNISYTQL